MCNREHMKFFRRQLTWGGSIRAVLAVLLAVVPLSFSTLAAQLTESTAILMTYGIVGLVVLLALGDLAVHKQWAYQWSWFDAVVAGLVLVALLASVFGVDVYQSIAGYQLIMGTSWLSIVVLAIVYLMIRRYITERGHVLMVMTAVATSLTLVSIIHVVGRFVPVPVVVFSGSYDMIGIGAGFASLLWGLLALVARLVWFKRMSSILWVVSTLAVLMINNVIGLLLVVVTLFCFILMTSLQAEVLRRGFMWMMTGYMAVLTLAVAFPLMGMLGLPRMVDVALPLSHSARIAGDVLGHDLMLGVGLQNFAAAFYAYKPIELNTTPVWNVGFVRAGSTFFEVLTTLGVLGALVGVAGVFLFVTRGIRVMRAARASTQLDELKQFVLAAGIVSAGCALIVVSLITYLQWYLALLGVVIFALGAQLASSRAAAPQSLRMPVVHAAVYLGVFAVLMGAYYGGRWHLGSAYVYAQYDDIAQARQGVDRALRYNDRQAETYIVHAQLTMQELVQAEDTRTAQRLDEVIVNDFTHAQAMAGERAQVYASLRASMLQYLELGGSVLPDIAVVTTTLKKLDPFNPQIYVEDGLLQMLLARQAAETGVDPQGFLTKAEDLFLQAIELKPNYTGAYIQLGSLYADAWGRYDEAEQQYLRSLALDPLNRETVIALLDLMIYHTDKADDALALLERYLQDNPDDAVLLLHKEEFLIYLGRDEDAAVVTQRIEELGIERPAPVEHTHADGTTHAHIVE